MKIFYEKEAGTALYQWKYQTPEHMDDMIMCSDGEYLTGLWFEKSEDVDTYVINCEERNVRYSWRQSNGWISIFPAGIRRMFRRSGSIISHHSVRKS